jgi:enamine deaminase RidA (YjgF/YER057c/UK114 family)/peptidase E
MTTEQCGWCAGRQFMRQVKWQAWLVLCVILVVAGVVLGGEAISLEATKGPQAEAPTGLRFVEPNKETGTSQAVVVDPVALAHTSQFLPLDTEGRIVGKDNPATQIEQVLNHLAAALKEAQTSFDRAVKVNVYVRRPEVVAEVHRALARRFSGPSKPAVTFVEGMLPHPDALVAMDAVAAVPESKVTDVKRSRSAALPGARNGTHVAILPAGPHVYVSGQAGKGDGIVKPTRQTMEDLRATLKHLSLDEKHVVQVKAFLNPMSAAADAEKEIAKCFGDQPVPPLVFVEWKYDIPIEIELVAAGRPAKEKTPAAIEFLTPPGVEASPVYSRVARINHGKLIYVSGLYGKTAKADAQVREVFAALDQLLAKTGSDSQHLAKATYYVVDEDVTGKLGEFRKKHYDPRRPPAASKAKVAGVGLAGKTITMDMIAVAPSARADGPPVRRIFGSGGGILAGDPDRRLLRYILSLTGKPEPVICYLPTAGGDKAEAIVSWYETMNALPCRPRHLRLFGPTRHLRDFEKQLLSADVILVPGGNTLNMLAVWKVQGVDTVLRKAWERGIVLAGESAGMACWFEQVLTDSRPDRLTPMECLGWLKGSVCPHYDSERQRKPLWHQLVARGAMKDGWACDEGVGLLFEGDKLAKVVTTTAKGTAYWVRRNGDQLIEEPLKAELLGKTP